MDAAILSSETGGCDRRGTVDASTGASGADNLKRSLTIATRSVQTIIQTASSLVGQFCATDDELFQVSRSSERGSTGRVAPNTGA